MGGESGEEYHIEPWMGGEKVIQSVKLGDVVHANAGLQKAKSIGRGMYKGAIVSPLDTVSVEESALNP